MCSQFRNVSSFRNIRNILTRNCDSLIDCWDLLRVNPGLHGSKLSNGKSQIVRLLSVQHCHNRLAAVACREIKPLNYSDRSICKKCYTRTLYTSYPLLNNKEITVETPPFAESITNGDVHFMKAVGDTVEVNELLCELETDKTTVEVPSPVSGVITALLVAEGTSVTAHTPLCSIQEGGGGGSSSAETKPAQTSSGDDSPASRRHSDSTTTSPPPVTPPISHPSPPPSPPPPSSVKIDGPIPTTAPPIPPLPTEPLTPPGKLADVKIITRSPPPHPPHPSTPPATAATVRASTPSTSTTGGRSEQRVPMNRMRQRIAERLKEAQNTCAMLSTFNEVDMSNIIDLRKQYKDSFLKKHNVKLGFMSAFVRAAAHALTDQPVVNAVIDGKEIVYRDYIDISVAVATPKGLVVPVMRNVEKMNFAELEKQMVELGEKARAGALAIEDMTGGTFTISNGGVFGSMLGTPIINPPQSAILGMHAINDRPVAINGKVEIRPMMYVALTYDHRLIDGREATTFLRKIKSAVEDPRTILLDL